MTLLDQQEVSFKYHRFTFTRTKHSLRKYITNYKTNLGDLKLIVSVHADEDDVIHVNLGLASDCCGESFCLSLTSDWACLACMNIFYFRKKPLIHERRRIWLLDRTEEATDSVRLSLPQEEGFSQFVAEKLSIDSLEAIVATQMFLYELNEFLAGEPVSKKPTNF